MRIKCFCKNTIFIFQTTNVGTLPRSKQACQTWKKVYPSRRTHQVHQDKLVALPDTSEDPRFLVLMSRIRYWLFKRAWVALLCSARAHAETVPQHFHELLRISMRQFFTFLSCTNPHISISTNSGIPILSVLVSSHLLQSRGCHHSHYQMRGWTSTKPVTTARELSGKPTTFLQLLSAKQQSTSCFWESCLSGFLDVFSESGRIPNFWPWFSVTAKPEQASS